MRDRPGLLTVLATMLALPGLLPEACPAQERGEKAAPERPRLKLRLARTHMAPGAELEARVTLENPSSRRMVFDLELERRHDRADSLASVVRLVARDSRGRHVGLGTFGNWNRGPSRVKFEAPAHDTLQATLRVPLGYVLLKGHERKLLPEGRYDVYAVLGDQQAHWYGSDRPAGPLRSGLVPIVIAKGPAPLRATDLAWLSGLWTGKTGAATIEEHWSTPGAGTLVGTFRWLQGDAVRFYEFLILEEDAQGMVMRFKHFNRGYEPWEKGAPITLRASLDVRGRLVLTNVKPGAAPARIVYERQTASKLRVRVVPPKRTPPGKILELSFVRAACR